MEIAATTKPNEMALKVWASEREKGEKRSQQNFSIKSFVQIAFPTPKKTHNYQIFEDDESERAAENVAHKHEIPHSNL